MKQKPKEGADLFERDPKTGRKTDSRIWDAMLNGDKEKGFDGMDPESLKQRRKERGE